MPVDAQPEGKGSSVRRHRRNIFELQDVDFWTERALQPSFASSRRRKPDDGNELGASGDLLPVGIHVNGGNHRALRGTSRRAGLIVGGALGLSLAAGLVVLSGHPASPSSQRTESGGGSISQPTLRSKGRLAESSPPSVPSEARLRFRNEKRPAPASHRSAGREEIHFHSARAPANTRAAVATTHGVALTGEFGFER
jgi:hypothetical protein